jgi:hypothetical protein
LSVDPNIFGPLLSSSDLKRRDFDMAFWSRFDPRRPGYEAEKDEAAQAAEVARENAIRLEECTAIIDRAEQAMTGSERTRYAALLTFLRKDVADFSWRPAYLRDNFSKVVAVFDKEFARLLAENGHEPQPRPRRQDAWRTRDRSHLVPDDQPAAAEGLVVTAEMIIAAAAKARGEIPPEKTVDPAKAALRQKSWLRK